jgi:adenosine/AMP kinase
VKRVCTLKKEQSMARVRHDAAINDLIVLQKRNEVEKIPAAQQLCVELRDAYLINIITLMNINIGNYQININMI